MTLRGALHFAAACGIIAGITLGYSRLIRVNSTTVALTLLMGVLGIAAKWGLAEAVAASLAAIVCFNFFFLPPVRTFTIEDPQNWVALVAFLVTAVVASKLSDSARRRAREATQLYALSRAMMLADVRQEAAQQVAQLVAQNFDVPTVVVYDRRSHKSYAAGAPDVAVPDQNTEIRLGGELLGNISLRGTRVSDTAVHSIANLAAIALERARSLEAASRAEAARQSEELKSMLLDAVTHEFKTPLTSIKAGATALLSDASTLPAHRELLTVIDEETDRLNAMITEAIQVARIEAGSVQLNRGSHRVSKLATQAVARLRPLLAERPLELEIPADLPPVSADADLVSVVISHLLDNAIVYSQAGTPIALAARQNGETVVISIADRGPGIAPEDRERVFERFYRGRTASPVPGTGMGLSIAREIVRVHGGRIWVEDGREGGACFLFTLPLAQPGVGDEQR